MLQEHQGCLKAACDLETQQESLDEHNHVRRVAERLKPQHGKEEEEHLAVRGQCSQPSPDQTLKCCDQVLPCQLHIRTATHGPGACRSKRPQPKRPHTNTATTITATNQNGHTPKRPHTKTATNQNNLIVAIERILSDTMNCRSFLICTK